MWNLWSWGWAMVAFGTTLLTLSLTILTLETLSDHARRRNPIVAGIFPRIRFRYARHGVREINWEQSVEMMPLPTHGLIHLDPNFFADMNLLGHLAPRISRIHLYSRAVASMLVQRRNSHLLQTIPLSHTEKQLKTPEHHVKLRTQHAEGWCFMR